jgi:hypothetical protein
MPEFPYLKPDRQIENRNFLQPTQFLFTLSRTPKASFYSNRANIPSMNLGIADFPTPFRDLPEPGDKITFEDLNLQFLVDENLENYLEIHKWIKGLGYPEDLHQIYDLQRENLAKEYGKINPGLGIYSDGTLQVLNSSQRPNFLVKYFNLFPYGLTTLLFDATLTDSDPFTAEVKFKYSHYIITDNKGTPL